MTAPTTPAAPAAAGDAPPLAEWLRQAPFALGLSAGYFGIFAHAGAIAALEEAGIRPALVSGASGGALVGTCWAAGREASALRDYLFGLRKAAFWDPALGLGLLRGERFRAEIRAFAPVARLEDCPIPVRISAFDCRTRRTQILASGPLAEAVYASCAVPLLFQPLRLNGGYYLDGGLRDRPGLAGAAEAPRVLHHHLQPHRSWRHPLRPHSPLPRRPGLMIVTVAGLPRVGPDRLGLGPLAFAMAYRAFRAALATPCPADGVLRFTGA